MNAKRKRTRREPGTILPEAAFSGPDIPLRDTGGHRHGAKHCRGRYSVHLLAGGRSKLALVGFPFFVFCMIQMCTVLVRATEPVEGLGYNTAGGESPLCWTTRIIPESANETSAELMHSSPILPIPIACRNVTLALHRPTAVQDQQIEEPPSSHIYRTKVKYEYPIEIDLDVQSLLAGDGDAYGAPPERVGVKLLFCLVGRVGFCSPFVHDEAIWLESGEYVYDDEALTVHSTISSDMSTHIDSETVWIDLEPQDSVIRTTMYIEAVIPQPGDYFPIVAVQFFSASDENSAAYYYRWDIANALPPSDPWSPTPSSEAAFSRILVMQDPPQIAEVSQGVRVFSFCAIAISAAILVWLIWQTLRYRKMPVLNLSQADFLVVFLLSALVATVSAFLWQPHSDLYCQMSSPMILIPVQLMYSITLGRLWRIHAVVSPLLLEQYRKKLGNHMVWRLQLIQCLQYVARIPQQCFRCFKCCRHWKSDGGTDTRSSSSHSAHAGTPNYRRRKTERGVRRAVTSKQLSLVVLFFVFPQILLQVCSLVLQPQSLELVWNSDYSVATPQCTNGKVWYKSISSYCYAALMFLMVTLLIMAFSSRKLPSLFNETSVIYQTAMNTLILILLGLIVIGITTQTNDIADDGNSRSSSRRRNPDVQYLVWVTVLLSITLGSSIRLMVPKLQMVWRGETVVVSKLVSDHHHHLRQRESTGGNRVSMLTSFASTAAGAKLLHNVTGLNYDDEPDERDEPDEPPREPRVSWSRQGSSYRSMGTDNSSDYFDPLTPLPPEEGGSRRRILDVSRLKGSSGRLQVDDTESMENGQARTEGRSSMSGLPSAPMLFETDEPDNALNQGMNGIFALEGRFGHYLSHNFAAKRINSNDSEVNGDSKVSSPPSRPPMPGMLTRQRTSRDVLTASANDVDRRKMFLRKRSSRYGFAQPKIIVSPEETPPRRLVLKMVDLQEELASVNKNIMSGLAVKPEAWDAVVDLVTRVEKNFREDVVFSWRPEPPPQQQSVRNLQQQVQVQVQVPMPAPTGLPMRETSTDSYQTVGGMSVLPQLTSLREIEEEEDPSDRPMSINDEVAVPESPGGTSTSSLRRKRISLMKLEGEFRKIVEVRDRKHKMIKYDKVFIGSEAVDAMLYAGLAESREAAVNLGRRLAKERRLFQHIHNEHEFEDQLLFYRFVDQDGDSLSSLEEEDEEESSDELSVKKEEANLEEAALRFAEIVKVGERRYKRKVYSNVFVGSEAVDAIVYDGLAATRWEAVQLGRQLARELRLFDHVSGDYELRDEFLLYSFNGETVRRVSAGLVGTREGANDDSHLVPRKSELAAKADAFRMYVDIRDRRFRMQSCKQTFVGSEAVDAIIYAGLANTREKAVDLGRTLQRELRLFQCISGDRPFEDGLAFYRFRSDLLGQEPSDPQDQASGNNRHQLLKDIRNSRLPSTTHLVSKLQMFKQVVTVSDRMHNFRRYKQVFVGCEAVDAMVFSGMASTRKDAVQLGRALAREYRLFKHVTDDSRYAFSDEFLLYAYNTEVEGSVEDFLDQSFSTDANSAKISDIVVATTRGELGVKADLFRSCVDVRDRIHRMIKYKSCFIGCEAIDAMLFAGIAQSRAEALSIGQSLATQLRLFRPCNVGARSAFEDAHVFYRFLDDPRNNSSSELLDSSTGGGSVVSRKRLSAMADAFKTCAEVKDRKHRFKVYKDSFVGCDTVDALVKAGIVDNRRDAVEYGRTLARELNLFHSVSGDYAFCDDLVFYSFLSDGNVSSANVSGDFSDRSMGSYNSRSVGGEFGDLPVVNENEESAAEAREVASAPAPRGSGRKPGSSEMDLPIVLEVEGLSSEDNASDGASDD